jgi:murein L,D-transpeptidase YcbB/YkuD
MAKRRRRAARRSKKRSTGKKKHVVGVKKSHKGLIIAGVGAAAILAIILLEKKASAAPNQINPAPTPTPTPPGTTPGTPTTPVQVAANNMAVALQSNGYRLSDQAIYKAFQAAQGLTQDGFPGTNTMNALQSVMQSYGATWPFTDGYTTNTIVVYPWSASGTYDGVNAPTSAEWNR